MNKELNPLKIFMGTQEIKDLKMHDLLKSKICIFSNEEYEIIKKALKRIEAIESVDGLETKEALDYLLDSCNDYINYQVIGALSRKESVMKRYNTIKNHILKSQQQAKELEELKKPPTEQDVCRALEKSLNLRVVYDKEDGCFYELCDDGIRQILVELDNGYIDFYSDGFTPHLITMIGRFYEGRKE